MELEGGVARSRNRQPHATFLRIPDPWRGWISQRRLRRRLEADAFARTHNARQPADAPTINFYPHHLGPNAALALAMQRMEARIGFTPGAGALTFAWDTDTFFPARAAGRLPANAVNGRCLDISKTKVDRVWAEVAGYSITVDPTTTKGPIVEKPDKNAMHGGRVIDGPISEPRPGYVYQRLVDSSDGKRILHLRPVILDGRFVLTYAKWRPYGSWFVGTELTMPKQTDELLSADDQALLLRFAAAMGFDYGEMDVLSDRYSGQIYVVDANRTPVRPKGLPPDQEEASFLPTAAALTDLINRRQTS